MQRAKRRAGTAAHTGSTSWSAHKGPAEACNCCTLLSTPCLQEVPGLGVATANCQQPATCCMKMSLPYLQDSLPKQFLSGVKCKCLIG